MVNFMAYVGILFGYGLELVTSKAPRAAGVVVTLLLVASNVHLLWGGCPPPTPQDQIPEPRPLNTCAEGPWHRP